ncbi:MAG: trypsin-like peptidase domain-containing protein [Planctomycetota bacterium]
MSRFRSCLVLLLSVWFSAATRSGEPIVLDPEILAAEKARVAAIDRARPSAVSVFVPGGGGGGSGVLISPEGYALTNFHVTSPAGTFMRCGLADGRVYDAVLVGLDPVGDLAMIRLLGRNDFPYATIGDSLKAQAGDWCMVIGNPFLLATNLQPTVTWGILSGVGRYQYPSGTLLEYADCLQTDASINPGNSGGPIYDAEGRLLGIVGRASFEKRGRVNVGVGYAISINQAKNFLGYLRSGRIVDHATLGASVTTDPDGGAVVSNILESSDAYRRGLRYDAEILEIDGRVVKTANEVQNVLATLPKNWRVPIAFRLNGETKRALVRLMGVHRQDELLGKMSSALPPPPPVPDAEPEDSDEKQEDGDAPDDAPQRPQGRQQAKKIPESASKLIVEKRGYANYYFNSLQQDRLFDSMRDQFPAKEAEDHGRWVINGKNEAGGNVKITIASKEYGVVAGEMAMQASTRAELYDGIEAGSVAGLLPALDAWRTMIDVGPKEFGESYYYGTMPLGGERPLRDCLVGVFGELEVRWLMHPETGLVECIEVFADPDSDPAEVWIERDDDKVTTLDLRYGPSSLLKVTVEDWKREAAE